MSYDKTCRIYISSEDSLHLFSPCRCKGSMAYVHRYCLKDWIEISVRSACEVCGQQWKSGLTINKIINFTTNNFKIFIGTLSLTLFLATLIVYLNLFKYDCQNIFNIDSTNKCKFLNTFLYIDYAILFCFDIYGTVFFCCLFLKYITKQGLVQDYSQRIEGANIYRQKLSRLKLSRLRHHRLRLSRLGPMGLGSLGWGPWAKAL